MDEDKANIKTEWITFVAMIIGTISIVASEYKITGTMPHIIAEWSIDVTTAGLLMTIPAVTSLLIAIPGGSIVKRFGARNVLLATLACDLFANVLGALATNFAVLASMRLIDGMSVGMSIIVVPSIISQVFPAEKRGLPMTLWGIRTALGTLLILNVCNAITPLYGWQANWWVAAMFIGIAFALGFLFVKVPAGAAKVQKTSTSEQNAKVQKGEGMLDCLKNRSALCICIANFTAFFGFSAYVTYYPTYLTMSLGLPSAQANSITTIHTYLMIIICLTLGFILNRIPNRKHPKLLLAALIMSFTGNLLLWTTPSVALDIVGILLCSAGFQFAAPLNHNLMPDVVKPESVPIGMGMLALFTSLSAMCSTFICGRIVDISGGNWALLSIPACTMTALGIIACVILIYRMTARHADDELC